MILSLDISEQQMPIEWHWVPGKSVGPFRFGHPIHSYLSTMRLIQREPDLTEWDTFEIPDVATQLFTDHVGNVVSVLCRDALEYQGVNLLGKSVDEIRGVLGPEDVLEDGVALGAAMYYTQRLGLTIWIDENGYAESASCGFTNEELDRQDKEERRAKSEG